MKKFIYELIINVLTFVFVVHIIGSIALPGNLGYWIVTVFGIGIMLMAYRPLLRFLTVQRTFLTQSLSVCILAGAALYVFDAFAPAFFVDGFQFDGTSLSFVTFESFTVPKIGAIIISSVIIGLISAIIDSLKSVE